MAVEKNKESMSNYKDQSVTANSPVYEDYDE